MDVFFLDFDGVVLDSAGETAITAWRGGCRLWPEDWRGDTPPAWLVDAFRRLRPLLHTGYEAFGLLRLAWLAGDGGGGELAANRENQERARQLLTATGKDREELVELFGSTRDAWLKNDFPGWLQANCFYPGVVEALHRRLREADSELFILTTKQERFVSALLDYAGINLASSRIFGLDTGLSKEEQLIELLEINDFTGRELHFVEDRLPTLRAVSAVERLHDLHLYLATWGYVTTADFEHLPEHPGVVPLSLLDFIRLLDPQGGKPGR